MRTPPMVVTGSAALRPTVRTVWPRWVRCAVVWPVSQSAYVS